jgi:hypothetical protein
MDRREYLLTAGTAGFAAIAGCGEEDDSQEPEPTDNQGDDEESQPSGNEDGTEGNEGSNEETNGEEGEAVFEFTEIVADGETYSPGDEVEIGAIVENTGSNTGEQVIEIQSDWFTYEEEVELEASEQITFGARWNNPSEIESGATGELEYTISSNDDEITGGLIINEGEAIFEFTGVTTDEETFSQNEEVPVRANIENTGNIVGEQTIELEIGNESSELNTELEPGETTTVGPTFEGNDFTTGTWEYTFSSDNDDISGSFEIEEPAKAIFEFTDIEPGDESIEQGPVIDVSATVENTGEADGTKEVTFELDGGATDSTELTLEAGENTSVTIQVDTEAFAPDEYEYTFSTEDSEISAILTITEPTVEQPETQTFSGRGQSVERGVNIEGGLTVIRATHDGSSNFQVSLVNDSEFDDSFINVIGEFDGAQAELIDSGEYILDVNADGSWEIELIQPRSANGESLPESLSGNGPEVVGPIEFNGTHS